MNILIINGKSSVQRYVKYADCHRKYYPQIAQICKKEQRHIYAKRYTKVLWKEMVSSAKNGIYMEVMKINTDYQHLVNQISKKYLQGQKKAVVAINKYHLDTYWQMGSTEWNLSREVKQKLNMEKGLLKIFLKTFHFYTAGVSV
jgi:hypothetical protein